MKLSRVGFVAALLPLIVPMIAAEESSIRMDEIERAWVPLITTSHLPDECH